jgi:hypothetical protein
VEYYSTMDSARERLQTAFDQLEQAMESDEDGLEDRAAENAINLQWKLSRAMDQLQAAFKLATKREEDAARLRECIENEQARNYILRAATVAKRLAACEADKRTAEAELLRYRRGPLVVARELQSRQSEVEQAETKLRTANAASVEAQTQMDSAREEAQAAAAERAKHKSMMLRHGVELAFEVADSMRLRLAVVQTRAVLAARATDEAQRRTFDGQAADIATKLDHAEQRVQVLTQQVEEQEASSKASLRCKEVLASLQHTSEAVAAEAAALKAKQDAALATAIHTALMMATARRGYIGTEDKKRVAVAELAQKEAMAADIRLAEDAEHIQTRAETKAASNEA